MNLIFLLFIIASLHFVRPRKKKGSEEDIDQEEEEEDMEGFDENNPQAKRKPLTGFEKCISLKGLKSLYTESAKRIKGKAFQIAYTPAYPDVPNVYFKKGSNKVFGYDEKWKRSYLVWPKEAIAFYKKSFDPHKKDAMGLSWDNLVKGVSSASFVNQMEQCVFYSRVIDNVGFLTELLDKPLPLLSALNSDKVGLAKPLYAGFYQLSRAFHYLLSRKYFVINMNKEAIGVRMAGNFPVFRLSKIDLILSTCHLDKFEGISIKEVLKDKPSDKKKEEYFAENKQLCYNASIYQLLDTFLELYKALGVTVNFGLCLEKVFDSTKCPAEVVEVLKKDAGLAHSLRRIFEQQHLSDYEYMGNIKYLIKFFGLLVDPKFDMKAAMKNPKKAGSEELDEVDSDEADTEEEEEEEEEEEGLVGSNEEVDQEEEESAKEHLENSLVAQPSQSSRISQNSNPSLMGQSLNQSQQLSLIQKKPQAQSLMGGKSMASAKSNVLLSNASQKVSQGSLIDRPLQSSNKLSARGGPLQSQASRKGSNARPGMSSAQNLSLNSAHNLPSQASASLIQRPNKPKATQPNKNIQLQPFAKNQKAVFASQREQAIPKPFQPQKQKAIATVRENVRKHDLRVIV